MQNLRNAEKKTDGAISHARTAGQVISYGLLCLISLFASAPAWAGVVGSVTHLGGVFFAVRADGTSKLLSVKSEVMEGDTLKTEKDTFARIKFVDGGEIVLRPETVFKVSSYNYTAAPTGKSQDNIVMSLLKGGLRSVTGLLGKRSPDKFQLQTPAATIGIRGTHLGALYCDNDCDNIPTVSGHAPGNGLHTDTAQGVAVVSNAAGSTDVPAGAFSYTPNPSTPPKLVPPSQGIQVTMPTSISSNKATGGGVGSSDSSACTVK